MLQQLVWTTGGLLSVFLSLSSSLSCLITSCSFHTFLSLSLCVIFSWILFSLPSTPSPLPLCGLSLISCATLASVFFKQLVFSWTPTSNIHFKRTETISCLKKKKKPLSLICPALPHSLLPSLSRSSPPSVPPHPKCCLFITIGAFLLQVVASALAGWLAPTNMCACACVWSGAVGSLVISQGISSSL